MDASSISYSMAQASDGQCNSVRPGFFDFQGKQKWDAWHALGELSPEDAMEQYVDRVARIDPAWQEKSSAAVGLGVAVSVPARPPEEELADSDKTVFDWCVEGAVDRVESMLQAGADVNATDDQGLALLHWACDRGHESMVETLLRHDACLDAQDSEGQTALHYACSCEHERLVALLVRRGADVAVEDAEGSRPADCTDNPAIKHMLEKT